MHGLPQLAGLRCSWLDKSISSVAEGAFCASCFNPVHNNCRPSPGNPVPEGFCVDCGANPNSETAQRVQAEVEEHSAKGHPALICPRCGSSHGFSPYGSEGRSG